jgi:hypothetical protein
MPIYLTGSWYKAASPMKIPYPTVHIEQGLMIMGMLRPLHERPDELAVVDLKSSLKVKELGKEVRKFLILNIQKPHPYFCQEREK